ncbi:hypothetical protein O3P69_020051 [Scylla paramamosain]|uniref:Uncharacterized protein n=1 Tax=Scylla paramamosain TaxID=85552 RepID=A0AAW0TK17_SCYPA
MVVLTLIGQCIFDPAALIGPRLAIGRARAMGAGSLPPPRTPGGVSRDVWRAAGALKVAVDFVGSGLTGIAHELGVASCVYSPVAALVVILLLLLLPHDSCRCTLPHHHHLVLSLLLLLLLAVAVVVLCCVMSESTLHHHPCLVLVLRLVVVVVVVVSWGMKFVDLFWHARTHARRHLVWRAC